MDEFARFTRAQDPIWSTVLAELRLGRKSSHWMWFVFPQLGSLGRSQTAKLFGLNDLDHATRYLAHPILGPRLVEVSDLVLTHPDRKATEIFGSIDAQKLCSSMTLFERAATIERSFTKVLDTFYGGARCPLTEAILGRTEGLADA